MAQAPDSESRATTAERRHLTVMFCDLVDSTRLSESMDAEDLRDIIRGYQAVAAQTIAVYEGHVAQYLGDGLLIYFGYPQAHEDDAKRAVLASIDLLEQIQQLSLNGKPVKLELRIGIHSGQVVIGEVGSHGRVENLALGAVPNIAARIQGQAAPGEVYVSEDTQKLIRGQVPTTSVGARHLSGISTPVSLFKIEDVVLTTATLTDVGSLVGRTREMATLAALHLQATEGEGSVAYITGRAGIGKSRLQREVFRKTSDRHRTLVCRCLPYHENDMLHPIANTIADLIRNDDPASTELNQGRLERWLATFSLVDRAATGLLLSDVLDISDAPGDQTQNQRLVALQDIASILCVVAQSNHAFVVEDLQWADPTTLQLLALMAAAIGEEKLMLVLTARDTFDFPWAGIRHTRIELDALNSADALAMVSNLAGTRIPASLQRGVALRSGGVPVFLEELTNTLLDLSEDVLKDLEPSDIPQTLQETLVSRIDALGSNKAVLQTAALLGVHFNRHLLQLVTRKTMSEIDSILQEILLSGLIERDADDPQDRFFFRQPLIQQMAYEMPLRKQRQKMHLEVVEALTTNFVREIELHPGDFARHLEGAGQNSQALEFYLRAGKKSLGRLAIVEATRCYRHALKLTENLESDDEKATPEWRARKGLGVALTIGGGFSSRELIQNCLRIRELADAMGDVRRQLFALQSLWGIYCVGGFREETHEVVKALNELIPRLNDPAQVRTVNGIVGQTAFYSGQIARAREILMQCMDEIPQGMQLDETNYNQNAGDLALRLVMAYCHVLAGYPDQGQRSLDELITLSEQSDSADFELIHTLCHINTVAFELRDDPEIARRGGQRVMQLSNEVDSRIWHQHGDGHQRWARAMQGDSSALEGMDELIRVAHNEEGISRGTSRLQVAQAHMCCGDLSEAQRILEEVIAQQQTSLSEYARAQSHCLRAELFELQEKPEGDIREELELAEKIAREQGNKIYERRALLALSRLDKKSNIPSDALDRLRIVHNFIREGQHLTEYQEAEQLLSQV